MSDQLFVICLDEELRKYPNEWPVARYLVSKYAAKRARVVVERVIGRESRERYRGHQLKQRRYRVEQEGRSFEGRAYRLEKQGGVS